tara:strand:+ start:789 stop:989 length:201 start_codon:yes stop_codon:yes gene_type:complete
MAFWLTPPPASYFTKKQQMIQDERKRRMTYYAVNALIGLTVVYCFLALNILIWELHKIFRAFCRSG